MEYAAFGDNWGKMGIPQFSPIFGDKEIATSMGKIGEFWGGDSPIFWGITGTNPLKNLKFQGGDRNNIFGDFGLTSSNPCARAGVSRVGRYFFGIPTLTSGIFAAP